MLHVYRRLRDLPFSQLMEIYIEGNSEKAQLEYPEEDFPVALINVEHDFHQYLRDVFYRNQGVFYAVWEEKNIYLSALRLEHYRDGLLLEALETHPDHRKCGYAKALICAVLDHLRCDGFVAVYAHVNKRNKASLRTHLSCGFTRVSEQSVYIDGSVDSRCCTLKYQF